MQTTKCRKSSQNPEYNPEIVDDDVLNLLQCSSHDFFTSLCSLNYFSLAIASSQSMAELRRSRGQKGTEHKQNEQLMTETQFGCSCVVFFFAACFVRVLGVCVVSTLLPL